MEPLGLAFIVALPLVAVGTVVTVLALAARAARGRTAAWSSAAKELGLTEVQLVRDAQCSLTGRLGRLRVIVTETPFHLEEKNPCPTEVLVDGGLPADVRIRRAGAPATARSWIDEHALTTDDDAFDAALRHALTTGDTAFDAAVRISGPPERALPLLDRNTRGALLHETARGVQLLDGQLFRPVPERLQTAGNVLDEIRPLVALARRLVVPANPVLALARNASEDPAGGVRAWCLALLGDRYAARPEAQEALRRGMSDPEERVRLTAALRLGTEGRPLVLQTAAALLEQAETTAKPQLALEAVSALAASGSSEAEPLLLAALDLDDANISLAAAEGLGRLGTVAAVPRLHAAAALFSSRTLSRAVSRAVAAIQARAVGAEHGQLALAEGEAGQLALSGDEAGRVALATDRTSDA